MNECYELEQHLTAITSTLANMKVPFFGYGDRDKLYNQINSMQQELRFFELLYKSTKLSYEEMDDVYEECCEKVKEMREELSILEAKTFERTHQGLLGYIRVMDQNELIKLRKIIKDRINNAYNADTPNNTRKKDDGNIHSSPRDDFGNTATTAAVFSSGGYSGSSSCSSTSSSSFDSGGSCGGGF